MDIINACDGVLSELQPVLFEEFSFGGFMDYLFNNYN